MANRVINHHHELSVSSSLWIQIYKSQAQNSKMGGTQFVKLQFHSLWWNLFCNLFSKQLFNPYLNISDFLLWLFIRDINIFTAVWWVDWTNRLPKNSFLLHQVTWNILCSKLAKSKIPGEYFLWPLTLRRLLACMWVCTHTWTCKDESPRIPWIKQEIIWGKTLHLFWKKKNSVGSKKKWIETCFYSGFQTFVPNRKKYKVINSIGG